MELNSFAGSIIFVYENVCVNDGDNFYKLSIECISQGLIIAIEKYETVTTFIAKKIPKIKRDHFT